MEYVIKERGQEWWKTQGVKCPDCESDSFTIVDQSFNVWMKHHVVDEYNDIEYKADMACYCSCKWTVSVKVIDAVKKGNLALRSVP